MSAKDRHRKATAEYAEAESAYESAAMLGDAEMLADADERLRQADEAYAESLTAVVAETRGPSRQQEGASSARAAAPSFEELLRDPFGQPDPGSEVLARMVVYAASVQQTVALPVPQPATPAPPALLSASSPQVAFENLLHDTPDRVCVG